MASRTAAPLPTVSLLDAPFHCDISFVTFRSADAYLLFNMFDDRLNSPDSGKAQVKPIAEASCINGTYATRSINAAIANVTQKKFLPLVTQICFGCWRLDKMQVQPKTTDDQDIADDDRWLA